MIENPENIKQHYIIGIGRSGTSLLSSILNSHSEILATPEVLFIVFFYHTFFRKKKFTAEEIDLLIEYIELYSVKHPYAGWNFNKEKLKSILKARNCQITFSDLCKLAHLSFETKGKNSERIKLIIDKNPINTLFAEKLMKLSNESKFILMVRDYRANILSRKQNPHLRGTNTYIHAIRWNFFNGKAKMLLQKYPENIFLLKYEDLAANPENSVKSVCKFLNIDFNPEMLNFYKLEQEKYSIPQIIKNETEKTRIHRGIKKYGDLTKPVNTSRIEAWKKELSFNDISIAEQICGKTGEFFGYQKFKKISLLKKSSIFFLGIPKLVLIKSERIRDIILFYISPFTKIIRVRQMYRS